MMYLKIFLICVIAFVANAIAGTPAICPRIISRNEWGARSPEQIQYAIRPVQYAIIQHTVTPECHTETNCVNRIFNMQSYHMDEKRYGDIAYNFMIGSDGQVYEGVGWHKVGTHTSGYNSKSVGIGFIGNFDGVFPNSAAVRAAKALLECGVALGELETNYKLLGARQISSTASPGLKLYREIQTWPHWSAYA